MLCYTAATMPSLLHDLISEAAARTPHACALRHDGQDVSYQALDAAVARVANGLLHAGLRTHERVAIYLP